MVPFRKHLYQLNSHILPASITPSIMVNQISQTNPSYPPASEMQEPDSS